MSSSVAALVLSLALSTANAQLWGETAGGVLDKLTAHVGPKCHSISGDKVEETWCATSCNVGSQLNFRCDPASGSQQVCECHEDRAFDADVFGSTPSGFGAFIEGAAVDKAGNVYAVNYGTNLDNMTIGVVTPEGESSLFFRASDAGCTFNGIRIARNGDMFLADYTNNRVYKLAGGDPEKPSVHCQFPGVPGMPNDMTLLENGDIYVSSMWWPRNSGEVWWCSADGKKVKKAIAEPLKRTNGIAVNPAEDTVYISEADGINSNPQDGVDKVESNRIFSYKIGHEGSLSDKTLFFDFAERGSSGYDIDGMRPDTDGNLYVTRNGNGRVVKLSPEGKYIREYTTTMNYLSNLEFGGPDGKTMYIVGRCNTPWGVGPGCMNVVQIEGAPGKSFEYLHREEQTAGFCVKAPSSFLSGCTWDTCEPFATLKEAMDKCVTQGSGCGGVTKDATGYTTRKGTELIASPSKEMSWTKGCTECLTSNGLEVSDYSAHGQCAGAISWMRASDAAGKPHWDDEKYTQYGVDGSPCSIQSYLNEHEAAKCPPCACSGRSGAPSPESPIAPVTPDPEGQ